jgi:protein O-mannosyl-transferase
LTGKKKRNDVIRNVAAAPAPRTWPWQALVVVAMAVAYAPVYFAGFIWDDDSYVINNPNLRDLAGLGRIWFAPLSNPQYYPVVHTTFWVEWQLWELHAPAFHAVNVACHAAGAIGLGMFLMRIGMPTARITSLVFALHPVQVESVAWITERKNVLSFPLAIAAGLLLLPFLGLASPPGPGRDGDQGRADGTWLRYAAALVLFALALLSKSVVCALPAVLLLLVWWRRGTIGVREIRTVAPLFAMGLAAGLHTAFLEQAHVGAGGDGFELSFAGRVLVAGRAVVFYARSLVWPQGLLFNYPRWSINPSAAWQWCFPAAVAIVLLATFLARRKIGRGPFAACAAYVGILFPALGFIDVYPFVFSFVADHFQYHASAALITLIVAGAAAAARAVFMTRDSNRLVAALTGGVLVVLAIATTRQAAVYHDLEALYRHTLAGNPRSLLAINNLADVMVRQGRLEEAVPLLEQAISLADIAEHRTLTQLTLTRVECRMHRRNGDHRAALAAVTRGLALAPEDRLLRLNAAELHQLLGEIEDAERGYRALLERQPADAAVMVSYGTLLSATSRVREAEEMYLRSFATEPSPRAAYNLAVIYSRTGRPGEAFAYASRAVALDPDDEDARNLLRAVRDGSPDWY